MRQSTVVPQRARPFRAGEVVMIHEDPYTKKRPEGAAVLVRCLEREDATGASRWVVRFSDDDFGGGGGEYERTVVRERVQ